MYRVMVVASRRENCGTLYKLLTHTVDEETVPIEIETKEELDIFVEKLLNEEGFSKDDFIIIDYIDYSIDAKDYSDDDNSDGDTGDTEPDQDIEPNP